MCIIAIKPKGKEMFSDELIETMFTNNPDGAGYMYYDSKLKKVVIKKGFMTLDALKKSLSQRNFTRTNLVLHFRIGTSGYNDKLNCHPYPVFQKNKLECRTNLGVVHNGILHSYTPPKDSKINDTQVFIRDVLSKLDRHFQYDKNVIRLIEELIGSNKLAFLDNLNQITTIGKFINDNGYLFSNTTYKERRYVYTPSYSCWDYYDYTTKDSKVDTLQEDIDYWRDILGEYWHDKLTKMFGEDYFDKNEFWDYADRNDLFISK